MLQAADAIYEAIASADIIQKELVKMKLFTTDFTKYGRAKIWLSFVRSQEA